MRARGPLQRGLAGKEAVANVFQDLLKLGLSVRKIATLLSQSSWTASHFNILRKLPIAFSGHAKVRATNAAEAHHAAILRNDAAHDTRNNQPQSFFNPDHS